MELRLVLVPSTIAPVHERTVFIFSQNKTTPSGPVFMFKANYVFLFDGESRGHELSLLRACIKEPELQ